ncbi:MAG: LuxR C-terminal-related transcriptional regulator [Burkholderiaceae bacterium]
MTDNLNNKDKSSSSETDDQFAIGSDQQFIDDIYAIALDPGNLDRFIDRLESEVTDDSKTRYDHEKVAALSGMFREHLIRAETFLDRIKSESHRSLTAQVLAPFEDSAALLVDPNLQIAEINTHGLNTFAVSSGDSVDGLPFMEEDLDDLVVLLRRLLRDQSAPSALAHVRLKGSAGISAGKLVVLHVRRLSVQGPPNQTVSGRSGYALIVSTELSWPDALDQTLGEVFGLTAAERDIVRALVEGKVLKSIAQDRDRSVGTVRVQLKSILAKTRARSQSELIRVTLSLMEMIKRAPDRYDRSNDLPGPHLPYLSLQFEPYKSFTRPNGRQVDFLIQGDPDGKPIIFSHMGYGLIRWRPEAILLAKAHKLKVIAPVRPGFGGTDTVTKTEDILQVIREDNLALMDHLEVGSCPYVVQGNDMLFALEFALSNRARISTIIGLGARLPLPSKLQYPGMAKWHRFLLSNARHTPHLLYFTCKAAFTLGRKVGSEALFRNVYKNSPADLAMGNDAELLATLMESSKLALSESRDAAFVFARELLETESNWSNIVEQSKDIPMWFVSGLQDGMTDPQTLASYEEYYPWIEIERFADAGQHIFFQKYRELIPRIAESAHQA